jgi:ABC-2 type transport system permease protein
MNIYKHELKTELRSILVWSVSIAALILLFLSIYPGFYKETALLQEMMANFPKELLIAFGMTNLDWSNILGYFGFTFLFCQICLGIQAANFGFSLVSIEENELTADFLLAKPVGRSKIMTSKLLAAITSLTITNAVVWIFCFIFIPIFSEGQDYSVRSLVLLLLSNSVFQLFFLSVGMVISLMVKRVRNVIPYSMGLVFGLYILNAFGGMLGEKSLEVISPFKHFDPNYIIKNAAFDPLVLVSVALILLSLVGSYILYARRNILSVT